jgi:hypothetical protein
MKLKYALALAAIAVVAVAAIVLGRGAQAQESEPTAGTLLVGDLQGATGATIGPDGALYVPQGGTGGDQVLEPPPEAGIEEEVTFGLTASIIRIDEDGTVTTEADELPSLAFDGEGGSIADVAFLGDDLYFLVTGSADALGVPEYPNGVYVVDGDGSGSELVADISEFNNANDPEFPDAAPGGNPFALETRGSGFVVSDGNFNRLLSVATNGDISLLAQFENVVPTGLASESSGPLHLTWFSAAPHLPGDSHVVSVGVPGGAVTQLASGPSSMIDVSYGPDDRIFVLQFSDFVEDESAPPAPTGRIYELVGSDLVLLVDGFVLPTSLDFSGETAYVTSLFGQVFQIENFSTLQPLPEPSPTAVPPTPAPPAPTATPGGGIAPPDTGNGGYLDSDGSSPWLAVLIAAASVLGLGGLVFAVKRA